MGDRRVRSVYILRCALPRALCRASTLLSQLADGMTYYSCLDLSLLTLIITMCQGQVNDLPLRVDPEGFEPSAFSMPLRRAPNCAMGPFTCIFSCLTSSDRWLIGHCSSGPEGIRTPGLLSAIEARSQLRYRPVIRHDVVSRAKAILIEAAWNVKQFKLYRCKASLSFLHISSTS